MNHTDQTTRGNRIPLQFEVLQALRVCRPPRPQDLECNYMIIEYSLRRTGQKRLSLSDTATERHLSIGPSTSIEDNVLYSYPNGDDECGEEEATAFMCDVTPDMPVGDAYLPFTSQWSMYYDYYELTLPRNIRRYVCEEMNALVKG